MEEKAAPDNFNLPRLNPLLKLYKAPDTAEGKPVWTLHDPLSNAYYQIGWAEFECLARFSSVNNAKALQEKISAETTLSIDIDDIRQLCAFLIERGLVSLQDQKISASVKKSQPFFKKAFHGYLYFSIPLVRPEKYLKKMLPYVRPFMSRGFIVSMVGLLVLGLLMTVQRADEFFNTFTGLLSWEGALVIMLSFAAVKIVHEMAHAFTAVRYGVPVPHMGVAMIVMYPVLYTEVTGSLRLASRRERFHIGIAGVAAELCLSAICLMLWHVLPYGSMGQSIVFSIVAISMVGSLLINLNPLMRFDGYYLLSDYLGIDNLQSRATAFARWKIRQIVWGFDDPAPEGFTAARQKILILFGYALLIYRLFLFLGIALLVYHVFFKPLGFIMMMLEISWFILLPIYSELKIWVARRAEILKSMQGKIMLGVIAAGFILMLVPIPRSAIVPAVMHAQSYRAIYPAAPSRIIMLNIAEGQMVEAGQVVAKLESPELMHEIAVAKQKLENLLQQQRSGQAQISYAQKDTSYQLDEEIDAARIEVEGLKARAENLWVRAPFDGVVRDLAPDLYPGRYIKKTDLLFRLIAPGVPAYTGYGGEGDLADIKPGDRAVFYPANSALDTAVLTLQDIDKTSSASVAWPVLASVYGGPIPAQVNPSDAQHIVPLTSIYALHFTSGQDDRQSGIVRAGYIRIEKQPSSLLFSLLKKSMTLWWKESGLN